MLLDVDKYCLELFECKTCFPQGLVKSLLYILDKSFIHTSPADHGDLDRLNRHLISCLARWSCSCSLFRIFRIQLAVALNTVALSEIISCGRVLLAMNAFNFRLNSSAVCDFVISRCTALKVAQVNVTM